jgi:hypothetical protein
MVATVISCICAIKAKNEAKRILIQMQKIKINFNDGNDLGDGSNINMGASVNNKGVIGGSISGGVSNNVNSRK